MISLVCVSLALSEVSSFSPPQPHFSRWAPHHAAPLMKNTVPQHIITPLSTARSFSLRMASSSTDTVEVSTLDELDDYFSDNEHRFRKQKKGRASREHLDEDDTEIDYARLLKTLKVVGDTQIIGSPSPEDRDKVHPVLKLLHERRKRNQSGKPVQDGKKVALVVEGGGMRGCVSAGMVAALHYLGLENTIDIVYGSSAGTVIGAYFITRQLPWFGPEIYYDSLPTAGKSFIDTKRILRAAGLGLLDPRLLKDVIARRSNGKPLLNLPFLLRTTLQERKPLNWERFCEMQKVQPLKVVASGLRSGKSVVLSMENGGFSSLEELANCMHASCLLPGIAGPLMNLKKGKISEAIDDDKLKLGNKLSDEHWEPLADALIYEPLPYRTAIAEGATHVVMLRTRPDGVDVTGKSSLIERRIMKRFFLRKNELGKSYEYMRTHQHKKLYASSVIELNEAAHDFRDHTDTSAPHIMPIALPPGSEEITRLETGRREIFEGVRRGFARAYDAFVEDPSERGRGELVAREYFPDAILDYEPHEFENKLESAFAVFLKKKEDAGEGYELPSALGKSAFEAGAPQ
eukprot:CAMPEP_0113532538 /NCGR_PEP_ID=MMETSP0015_2-20120614/4115_1 /TAXON_ID=2838 /ORGANISM="Odontella" /LENGTH=573 /DNA_ID=CAMNT_0000431511 /DNA_START=413 /DNA_END=2134 /DNA_ORIENTATION=+ /assembly_acc=CAM_ASM_000160